MTHHPVEVITAMNPGAALRLHLTPVKCIDCEEYVPFGWVEYGTVTCPKDPRYGHRIRNETYVHVQDLVYNTFSEEPK